MYISQANIISNTCCYRLHKNARTKPYIFTSSNTACLWKLKTPCLFSYLLYTVTYWTSAVTASKTSPPFRSHSAKWYFLGFWIYNPEYSTHLFYCYPFLLPVKALLKPDMLKKYSEILSTSESMQKLQPTAHNTWQSRMSAKRKNRRRQTSFQRCYSSRHYHLYPRMQFRCCGTTVPGSIILRYRLQTSPQQSSGLLGTSLNFRKAFEHSLILL